LKLRDAAAVLFDEATPDAEVRAVIFETVGRDLLKIAYDKVGVLAEPPDDVYFAELRKHRGQFRFAPALLRGLDLNAAPAGKSLLDAVEYVRAVQDGGKRSGPAPVAFAPKEWVSQLKTGDGKIDLFGYRLCVLDQLRRTIRRRHVFASRSLRYADPRKGLLSSAAWEAARPAVCRTVGVSASADEELTRLSARLDLAYRGTADRAPANPALSIEATTAGADLSVAQLDKIEEPPSLVALRAAVEARLPQVDLPELILEMQARTGFADRFTHVSEGGSRVEDIATSVSAVLVSEACNIGFEPLVRRGSPALRRSRLSWVKQNFLRADTDRGQRRAAGGTECGPTGAFLGRRRRRLGRRPALCRARAHHSFRSQSPLLRARARRHLVQSGVRPVHRPERDHHSRNAARQPVSLGSRPGAGNRAFSHRDHDGHGGLYRYDLRDFPSPRLQFSPRITEIGGSRFWRVDRKADYGLLDDLASNKINMRLIVDHWDDLLRLAGSLKLGVVRAAGLTRTLQTNDRPTKLARALQELGRLIKTLYLLRFIDDEHYRRRILIQLNRGENRHRLARVIFHGKRGELRQRYRYGQEDQLGSLGLVVNLVVLWNTVYMDAALNQLRAEGYEVKPEDVAHLSPLSFGHINMLGRYAFTLPEIIARGELRPLRDPSVAGIDDL